MTLLKLTWPSQRSIHPQMSVGPSQLSTHRACVYGLSSQSEPSKRAHRHQEDATNPMVAPQNYDVRQSGRVLELQNSDLWLRPTDLSWHFLVLMTIREEPFKNYRSRTSEKWKAKKDKAEEFKKQKMQKHDDGQCYANWQTSSWSWYQPTTWASSS